MKDNIICVGGNALTYILTALQTNEVFQIIELTLSIILTLVILIFRIWKWVKEVKEDGKITKEEIEEGMNIIEETKEELDKHEHND